jgi:peptide/nickel transport system substrate-binding protein
MTAANGAQRTIAATGTMFSRRGPLRSWCLLWLIGVPVLSALAGGCAPADSRDPGVIVVALRSAPNNLNPLLANDEFSSRVAQLVFSSLMDLGDDLRPQPTLADRLESPDPKTHIVHLKRGVRFHDGRELTSADVVYTYGLMLQPEFVSPHKGSFRNVASVVPIDKYSVRFTLTEPSVAFDVQLTTPPVVPAGSLDTLSRLPIGTGPYQFVRYDVENQVVLSAFDGYFRGAPGNKGMVLKVIPDDTMRGLELRKQSVDVVVNQMPPDIVHRFEELGEIQVTRQPGMDLSYIGFNLRDPVVADVRVRHAVSYAIDREAIVKHLRRGLAVVAHGVLPLQVWAAEPDVRQYAFDPERAKQLLDAAGYPDPDGDGPRPRLRLSLKVGNTEEVILQATVVQQDLRRVGIDLDVRSYEFATMFADVVQGNFQLSSLQWIGGALADPDILRRIFHSGQVPPNGFNRGRYRNPDVDRAIDLASSALDEGDRRRYYSRAQKLIAEDAPYIPIWHRTHAVIGQPYLSGLHINPAGNYESLRDVRRLTP